MMIPPPSFAAPDGIRVYPKDPVLDDKQSDRGEFIDGRRIDSATYLFEKAGDYTLPAIEIPWFDAASGKREVAQAPAIHVVVAVNPAFKPDIAPEAAPPVSAAAEPTLWQRIAPWLPWVGAAVVLVAILAWLVRHYGPRVRNYQAARRRERETSEAAAFADVEHACAANDAMAAYRAVGVWARRLGVPSLAALGSDAAAEFNALERALFAAPRSAEGWRGRSLVAALGVARKRRLTQADRASARGAALPALNP
ncbi:MAG: BatD family protein [Burkholderiales bacterium]|nr:BatD family protein [Burkholderiales bacterium]